MIVSSTKRISTVLTTATLTLFGCQDGGADRWTGDEGDRATASQAQALTITGPVGTASGFEDDDGNLAPDPDGGDGGVAINFDWNSFAPTTWTGTAPTRQSSRTVSGWQFRGFEDWAASTGDSAFAGGTKQDTACASLVTQRADNKADLERIYLASRTGDNGHTYLSLAWVRIPQNTTSPSAHIAFEFNQGTTACPGSPSLVQRVAGDMLILYDFEGGATDAPTLKLSRWVTSGACEIANNSPPCWGPADALTAGEAEARVNTSGPLLNGDAIAPAPPDSLGTNEFGEAGIDLTEAGVFPAGTCVSFGRAFGVSRTSGNSGTAQMKDLVGPGEFRLTNCGTITIIKQTDPRGIDQAFDFTSTIPATATCTSDATPNAFTLNDAGNVSGNSAGNTETCTNVPAGSYTVTEGADPAGFAFGSLVCNATGTGTSANTSGKQASITLAGEGSVTCVYTNNQQRGAILVTKTRKHAADGSGDHPHAGVSFTVNGVTRQTDANGQVCFDGLTFGDYDVTETVPTGYVADGDVTKTVTVDNNADCDDDPFGGETVSFGNTPLTNFTVSIDSQVNGGTASTMVCVDSSGTEVANGSTGANGDGSVTAENLLPDTYTCTLVIDP